MPQTLKRSAGVAGLVGSDSEPDLDSFDAIEMGASRQTARAAPVTKRPRGRPPGSGKITKPAAKAAPRAKGRTAESRQALADKSNTNTAKPFGKPGHGRALSEDEDEMALPDEQLPSPSKPSRGKATISTKPMLHSPSKRAASRPKPGSSRSVNERSTDAELGDESDASAMNEQVTTVGEVEEPSVALPSPSKGNRHDTSTDEVSLRRRLGDLTRKYESLESRYRDLHQVSVVEAERNFERLKKHAEASATAATKLIAELREELAVQKAAAKQGERLRRQLQDKESNCSELQAEVNDLNSSLGAAKSEIKTLSTKLAASRSAEAGAKVPGSAMKTASAGARAGSSEAMQAAQAKEDLYGDLTGLILRGVKQGDKEDVFDCIQTGRNGTLHFKLALDKAASPDNYEDVQFTYQPQLDEGRDADLIELLPDYLVEEITFPRPHAAKFYARVTRSLTERLE